MVTSSTSRAVRAARAITIGLLVLSVGFTALVLVSVATGLFRHGDSLLYGDSITVPMQVSADDLGTLPDGISVDDWLDVDVKIQDPTTSQMLLRSAQDLGPAFVIVWALVVAGRSPGFGCTGRSVRARQRPAIPQPGSSSDRRTGSRSTC